MQPDKKIPISAHFEKFMIGLGQKFAAFGYPTSWEKLEIDENNSLWASYTPDYHAAESLVGETTADLAIIGGGFTGVSTAYHFSRRYPEKRVIILEAKSLANGASGRNGGMLLNWINGIQDEGEEMSKRVYDFTRSGIDMIEDIIKAHRLDVSYRRDGTMTAFTNQERAEAAHRRIEWYNSIGIPVKFFNSAEIKQHIQLENVYGAEADFSEGQLNGAQYVRALRPVLEKQGVQIYEGTTVTKIEEGSTITLTTPQGTVKAKAIVLATNAYTGKLGYFRRAIFPLHSHVFATQALSQEQLDAVGWRGMAGYSDDLDRISYSSLSKEGHIIFGGGSNESYAYLFNNRTAYPGTPHSIPGAFSKMQETQTEYLPTARGLPVSHRWTGTLAISMMRNCSIGVMNGNIYYGLGYSGHGVTLANLAGKVIVDIYSGDDAEWRKHEWYNAKFVPIPLEPFRWMGYHMFTRLTGRSPRT